MRNYFCLLCLFFISLVIPSFLSGEPEKRVLSGKWVLESPTVIEAENITFEAGSVIITNGHSLRIMARTITINESAAIHSFEPRFFGLGEAGKSADEIRIRAQAISGGILYISNIGEDGGAGRNGRPGYRGSKGPSGTPAACTGGVGAPGGPGEVGGDGGNGGNGAPVILLVRTEALDHLQFDVRAGSGGVGGLGGLGGEGGEGGEPGRLFCAVTEWGPPGPVGPNGSNGNPGKPGLPGMVVRDMEATVQPPDGREIPEFPWPPPKASAFADIDSRLLRNPNPPTSLRNVSDRLLKALDQADYNERSWYSVPDGFALVTRMEQFNTDGSSKQLPDRWSVTLKPARQFSLAAYLRALFTANSGRFRIIVFIVTSRLFKQGIEPPDREKALAWLPEGLNALPDSIGKLEFSDKYYCTALIYEFEQITRDQEAKQKLPSDLDGKIHLQKAKLWNAFGR